MTDSANVHYYLDICIIIVFNNNHGRSLPSIEFLACSKAMLMFIMIYVIVCKTIAVALALTPPLRHQHHQVLSL